MLYPWLSIVSAGGRSKAFLRVASIDLDSGGRCRPPTDDLGGLLVLHQADHIGAHLEEGAGVGRVLDLAVMDHAQDVLDIAVEAMGDLLAHLGSRGAEAALRGVAA